jgi:uncharacterized membrane protein
MGHRLRRYFISGLIIFLPLALTINLFVLTINLADGFLGKYIQPYFSREFGFYVRGLSLLIGILIIFLIGFLATNIFGKRLYAVFERLLLRLPFFRQVYPAFKEIAVFLFSRDKATFKQVVMVEYPRKGVYSLGFLTSDISSKRITEKTRKELCSVLIPTVPTPLTGFMILVPQDELIFPDITVEEAIKMLVSAGVVNPM